MYIYNITKFSVITLEFYCVLDEYGLYDQLLFMRPTCLSDKNIQENINIKTNSYWIDGIQHQVYIYIIPLYKIITYLDSEIFSDRIHDFWHIMSIVEFLIKIHTLNKYHNSNEPFLDLTYRESKKYEKCIFLKWLCMEFYHLSVYIYKTNLWCSLYIAYYSYNGKFGYIVWPCI